MQGQEKTISQELENQSDHGQVNRSAADFYEEFFLPALFQEWSSRVADTAKIGQGQRVLDVACGTGALARTISKRVEPGGSIVGIDINEGMLAVARKKAPEIDWRHAPAEVLPFSDNSFDAVVSQFGLMFFEDQLAAIREMYRVLRPGGYMAVAVWGSLENTPGYAAMVDLLNRLFGNGAADALRAPYSLGDDNKLRTLFAAAGLPNVQIYTHLGTARFPSIESWVYTDVKGWTLADSISEKDNERLLEEAQQTLQPFVTPDGSVAFPAPAHIVRAMK